MYTQLTKPTTRASNQGFTLIDLIVAVVILGILAAIAVPKYLDYREQARIALLKGLMGVINDINAMSISAYYVQKPAALPGDANAADIIAADGSKLRVQTGAVLGGQPGLTSIGGMVQSFACSFSSTEGDIGNYQTGYMCNGFFVRGVYNADATTNYAVFRLNNSDNCAVIYQPLQQPPVKIVATACR